VCICGGARYQRDDRRFGLLENLGEGCRAPGRIILGAVDEFEGFNANSWELDEE